MTVLHPDGQNLTYKFAQFHFHAPAEHLLDGKEYDAELHLVHARTDADGSTSYAVLGVFLDASKDIESGLMERLQLETLPLQKDSELQYTYNYTPPVVTTPTVKSQSNAKQASTAKAGKRFLQISINPGSITGSNKNNATTAVPPITGTPNKTNTTNTTTTTKPNTTTGSNSTTGSTTNGTRPNSTSNNTGGVTIPTKPTNNSNTTNTTRPTNTTTNTTTGTTNTTRPNTTNSTTNPSTPVGIDKNNYTDVSVPLLHYIERISKSYYYYKGSLTTPPCTEAVTFLLLDEV